MNYINYQNLLAKAFETADVQEVARIGKLKGFFNGYYRKRSWTLLLKSLPSRQEQRQQSKVDRIQIKFDVERTLNSTEIERYTDQIITNIKREEINEVILDIMQENSQISYTQGFNQICKVFMSIFPKSTAKLLLTSLALNHYKVFLKDAQINIIKSMDFVLQICKIEMPHEESKFQAENFYKVSQWLITWFQRVLEYSSLYRLWDYLLSSEPLALFTVAAAFCLKRVVLINTLSPQQYQISIKNLNDVNLMQVIEKSQELLNNPAVLNLAVKNFGQDSLLNSQYYAKISKRKIVKKQGKSKTIFYVGVALTVVASIALVKFRGKII